MKSLVEFGREVSRQTRNLLENGVTPTRIHIDLNHFNNLCSKDVAVATGTAEGSTPNKPMFTGLEVVGRKGQWTPVVE